MSYPSVDTTKPLPDSTTRVIVISDLHLGGNPAMMGRPKLLESFIDSLHRNLMRDEKLELVIAGDFIDFLSIEPYAAITTDPIEAVDKLKTVISNESKFASVFDALKRHIAHGHKITVLVGNHDLELAIPEVQKALQYRLNASCEYLNFVDDGRAYRIGNALIEHGNAYDGANANDWDGIRHINSSLSRGKSPERNVRASVGSQIVHEIVNLLKDRYPFLPTLQPEGELLVLLLLTFEPELKYDANTIRQLFKILKGNALSKAPPEYGESPISANVNNIPYDAEIKKLFSEEFAHLESNEEPISIRSWIKKWRNENQDSLSFILRNGKSISSEKLKKLRLGISRIVNSDDSESSVGPTHQYGVAAENILKKITDLEVVVMGHTHLPRKIENEFGVYINTGTWINRFRVPDKALNDESGNEFLDFLKNLLIPENWPLLPPSYAELCIDINGHVRNADLRTYVESL